MTLSCTISMLLSTCPWKDSTCLQTFVKKNPSETVCKSDLVSMLRNRDLEVRSETFVTGFPGVYYSHTGMKVEGVCIPYSCPRFLQSTSLKGIDVRSIQHPLIGLKDRCNKYVLGTTKIHSPSKHQPHEKKSSFPGLEKSFEANVTRISWDR